MCSSFTHTSLQKTRTVVSCLADSVCAIVSREHHRITRSRQQKEVFSSLRQEVESWMHSAEKALEHDKDDISTHIKADLQVKSAPGVVILWICISMYI